MEAAYGGLRFTILSIDEYDCVPIYHENNQCGLQRTLTMTMLVNPYWMGVTEQAPFVVISQAPRQGQNPPNIIEPTTSIEALEKYLLTPRRKFFIEQPGAIQNNDLKWLTVDDDAMNGPIPQGVSIVQQVGVKTYLVSWRIRFNFNHNLGSKDLKDKSPILSHVWKSWDDIDSKGYTTRETQGEVIFDTSVLAKLKVIPDQYRKFMSSPLPSGFRREGIRVQQLGQSTTVKYHIVDKQTPLAPGSGFIKDIAHIEATQKDWLTQNGVDSILDGVNNGWKVAKDGITNVVLGLVGIPPKRMPDFRRDLLIGLGKDIDRVKKNVAGMIPLINRYVSVSVWGTPESNRRVLAEYAYKVYSARMGMLAKVLNIPGIPLGKHYMDLTQHLERRVVILTGKVSLGVKLSALGQIINIAQNDFLGGLPKPDAEDKTDNLIDDLIKDRKSFTHDNSSGLRTKTFLESLVASALNEGTAIPQINIAYPKEKDKN